MKQKYRWKDRNPQTRGKTNREEDGQTDGRTVDSQKDRKASKGKRVCDWPRQKSHKR